MPPVPEATLSEIKAAVSCAQYMESEGFTLKQSGEDFLCSCPLDGHEDKNPSFRMTGPLYNCLSRCGGGNVFQLVQKLEGCDFLAAVAKLARVGGVEFQPETYRTTGHAKPIADACPLNAGGSDAELTNQVIDFYQAQLLQRGNAGWEYLEKRGLADRDLVSRFRLGFAKRGELGKHLPSKQVHAGRTLRMQLEKNGFFKAGSGHEYFAGSLTIPIFAGAVLMDCYGRKTCQRLRAGTPKHLYLPKSARPQDSRGVWNIEGIEQSADKRLILCESLIDALSCYVNGFHHVSCAFGTAGFSDELLAAILSAGIQEVYIAYDNDDSGNTAAEKVAERLITEGLTVYRVQVPAGLNDVNAFCMEAGSDSKQRLFDLVAGAQWIGGKPCVADENETETNTQQKTPTQSTIPTPKKSSLQLIEQGDDLMCEIGSRCYRVRHFSKNTVAGVLKIQLRVLVNDDYFQENIELCSNKALRSFSKQASAELGLRDDVFHGDLKKLLRVCEDRQDDVLAAAAVGSAASANIPEMSNDEKDQALAALKDPDLIACIGNDLEKAGLIGEEISRLVCYLGATSRLLPDPLGIVIQSSSAAGKSSVMNSVLALMPDETQKTFVSMSKQSLLYLEENALEHKILGVAELAGAQDIAYNLKMLLSEKHLSMASVSQDPTTGEMKTREYHVNGPTALILTTTEEDDAIDSELLNRCLVVSVTESNAQTFSIFDRQRSSRTESGAYNSAARQDIITKHHNMQRMLRPLRVINNYAPQLTFIATETRHRRDHQKYLNLIDVIALLHQYQRPLKKHALGFEYIEVQPSDIATANRIAAVVLGRSLDPLTPKTRELLGIIDSFVAARALREEIPRDAVTFFRRELRSSCGWSDSLLKRYMKRLVDQELLSVQQSIGPHAWTYSMHYTCIEDAAHSAVLNLLDASTLKNPEAYGYDEKRTPFVKDWTPTGHPADTEQTPAGHVGQTPGIPAKDNANDKNQKITLKCV